jgi:lipoprotein-anchoring transpeptidase ErfK/SrfK
VSSGCIRLHNDDISRLVEELKVPAGVPVEVI